MFLTTLLYLSLTSTVFGAKDFLSLPRTDTSRNLVLTFSPNSSSIISSIASRSFSSRGEKITQLVANLKDNAQTSQEGVQQYLSQREIPFTPIWISNQLSIPNVDNELLSDLSFRFRNSDITIAEDVLIPMEQLYSKEPSVLQRDGIEEWGVKMVRSSEAHFLLSSMDITPSPVTVGIVDTGVRGTHEALWSSYYGDYGWFDPYSLFPTPYDDSGHGTHVTGTIMGTRGIGVANPINTKWMACKGCSTVSCSGTALLLCGQFITCPTYANGSTPDCSRAPAIVSNSWGSNVGGQEWFNVVIETWHAADIIPVFSAGNAGPECGTAGYPGDMNVISAGATTINDAIAVFSSRGPTVQGSAGDLKPDFSAPGQFVLSSTHESDSSYSNYSGTSMACPHISGVIAILKSVNPSLTYQEVKQWLRAGVDTASLLPGGQTCGGIADNVFPNFVYGHGRVNAYKTLMRMLATATTTTTTTPGTTGSTTTRGTTGAPNSGMGMKTWPSFGVGLYLLAQISKFSFQ